MGHLTSGVYHEFNNILTVILAQAGMMELVLSPEQDSRTQRSLDSIRGAAERGAKLVRRLSDFRNRRAQGNRLCDLEATIRSVVQMLERLLGDDIDISVETCGLSSAVKADPAILEQAMVELMMNAREAMPSGGKLSISTTAIELDGKPMVEVRVIDQGPGPSQNLIENPGKAGYSTKEGRAGIGLFLVASFIAESDGTLLFTPASGGGTEVCFRLHLSPLPDNP